MYGRSLIIAFMAGTGWVHTWPLIHFWALILAALSAALCCAAAWWFRRQRRAFIFSLAAALSLGVLYTALHAQARLAQRIPDEDVDRVSKITVQITSLVRLRPDSRQFHGKVIQAHPPGLPEQILLNWTSPVRKGPYDKAQPYDFPELLPGQVWHMSVKVKPVHGARNPHAFDYEQHLFAQGVRVVGGIRGTPRLLQDELGWSLPLRAERWRHRVRANMSTYLDQHAYGGVMLALAMGDQASIRPADWEHFNRAGLTHLVSISGSHVTLIALMVAALVSRLWRRLRWKGRLWAEFYPAQSAASWAAVVFAFAYCMLAGWGVPAQRTFLMLLVIALARLSGLSLGPSRVLLAAGLLVVLWDPWALLSSGFYLSFAAVAILLFSSYWLGLVVQVSKGWRRHRDALYQAVLLQLLITVALFPVLGYLFHEISLVSPLSNAYAIPLIGSVLTPLSLLLALLSSIPQCAWLAYYVAELSNVILLYIMHLTRYLNGSQWAAVITAAPPLSTVAWAMAGVVLLSMPRGFAPRWLGFFLMLPALFYKPEGLEPGQWQLTALDVGQGAAVVLRTATSVLLYDAGIRYSPESDEGVRTILPYLRSQGIKKLDVFVLSHADLDHVGGASSVLLKIPVRESWSGFDLAQFIRREERLLGRKPATVPLPGEMKACRQGAHWEVDGVRFEFVWPLEPELNSNAAQGSSQKNSQSCVLSVTGAHHTALITGDVGVSEENRMMEMGLGQHDLVMVGHHGSRSSSGHDFVSRVQAALAISQNGHWSQFSHPHHDVQDRWERAGSLFLRSDHHGAVQVKSDHQGLWYFTERERRQRYWQLVYP